MNRIVTIMVLAAWIAFQASMIYADSSLDAADGSPTEVVKVDNGGNVDISTQNVKVQGNGASALEAIFVQSSGNYLRLKHDGSDAYLQTDADGGKLKICPYDGDIIFMKGQNNSEYMVIKDGGNVGIGTTNPGAKLTVRGSLKLEGGSNGSNMYITPGTSVDGIDCHLIGTYSEGTGHRPFVFRTSSVNRMIIGTNGNVGIGTTAPSKRLHVTQNINDDATPIAEFQNSDATGTNAAGYLWVTGYGNNAIIKAYSDNHATKANLVEFGTVAGGTDVSICAGGGDRLHVNYDGKVGVGTDNPSARFNVKDDVNDDLVPNVEFYNANTGNAAAAYLRVMGDGNNAVIKAYGDHHSTKANLVEFGTVASGTDVAIYAGAADRLHVKYDGNVGIGTSSPNDLLHLTSNDPKIIFDDNAGGAQKDFSIVSKGALLQVRNESNDNTIAVFGTEPDGFFKLYDETGINTTLKLRGNGDSYFNGGKLGVGTTAPAEKLHISDAVGSSLINSSGDPEYVVDDDGMSALKITNTSIGYAGLRFNTSGSSDDAKLMYHQVNATNGVMLVGSEGNVDFEMKVRGKVTAQELRVTQEGWADFVFDPSYKLASLKDVERHIQENKHLPAIPTAAEVAEEGVDVGEMQAKLLQKVEELTLYLIDQNKKLEAQGERIEKLEKENRELRDN